MLNNVLHMLHSLPNGVWNACGTEYSDLERYNRTFVERLWNTVIHVQQLEMCVEHCGTRVEHCGTLWNLCGKLCNELRTLLSVDGQLWNVCETLLMVCGTCMEQIECVWNTGTCVEQLWKMC
jgi:hypothetical protein